MVFPTVFLALIARKYVPVTWAAAVALLWGIWLPAFFGNGVYHFWGPAFIVVMAWALLRAEPRPAIAGGAAAAALLFNQGMAPAVLAGLLVAYLARRRWRDAVLVAAGPALAGMLLGAGLIATGNLASFLDQAVGSTSGHYQEIVRKQPFPFNPLLLYDTLEWHLGVARFWAFPMFWLLGVAVPFGVAGYALFALLKALGRREAVPPAAVLAILSTGLLASAFIGRISGPICWLHAPLALLLVAMRLRVWIANPSPIRRLAVVAPALFLFVTGLSPAPLGYWMSCTTDPGGPLTTGVDTAAGRVCLRVDEAKEMRSVQAAVGRLRSPIVFLPDSPVLVPADRKPPVVPFLLDDAPLHEPVRGGLMEAAMPKANSVVYVEDSFLDTGHPWQFDDFLAANFEVVNRSPGVTVYARRPQSA